MIALTFAMPKEEDYWRLKDYNSLEDFSEKSIDFKKTIEKIANNGHKIAKKDFVKEHILLNWPLNDCMHESYRFLVDSLLLSCPLLELRHSYSKTTGLLWIKYSLEMCYSRSRL
jgi:hypothetical protein